MRAEVSPASEGKSGSLEARISSDHYVYGVYLFHAPIAWLALHKITPLALPRMRSIQLVVPQSPAVMNPTVMRFASAILIIATSMFAGLHFRYVQRRSLAMSHASASASGGGAVSHPHPAQACLSGSKP